MRTTHGILYAPANEHIERTDEHIGPQVIEGRHITAVKYRTVLRRSVFDDARRMSVVAWQMFPLGLQLFDGPTEPSAKHGCKNVRMKFVNLLKCENGTKFKKTVCTTFATHRLSKNSR